MSHVLLALILVLSGTLLVGGLVRPRQPLFASVFRSAAGSWLLVLLTLAVFGALLGLNGGPLYAAVLTLALHLLFVVASNAKRRMLGEPLLFSDLALVGAIFRHPQFYFSALAGWQKVSGLAALVVLVAAFAWFFEPSLLMHVTGVAISGVAAALLGITLRTQPFSSLAATPAAEKDVASLGLLPTLLLYWLRWRGMRKSPAGSAPKSIVRRVLEDGTTAQDAAPELIIAVQCESFADSAELFGDPALALPELERARAGAYQWGHLLVSGFGAYTMRTEYGVLFGRSENTLGFRSYDPFLTALDDAAYGLPHRLGTHEWHSSFVHPHDMRFYGRDGILPAAGFAELVGQDAFALPSPSDGRYVSDAAVADKIMAIARSASAPAFIYAVTIENHGPWSGQGKEGAADLVQNYNRLVRCGDAMLGELTRDVAALQRPALVVFFGDHRPSIPGASEPGGDRHTPYVMLRFDQTGSLLQGDNRRRDITPAELHHELLDTVRG